tara:strand:+ start:113 stop:658 length:546 start_codon:yes stop_codon:yes gene_type:complete
MTSILLDIYDMLTLEYFNGFIPEWYILQSISDKRSIERWHITRSINADQLQTEHDRLTIRKGSDLGLYTAYLHQIGIDLYLNNRKENFEITSISTQENSKEDELLQFGYLNWMSNGIMSNSGISSLVNNKIRNNSTYQEFYESLTQFHAIYYNIQKIEYSQYSEFADKKIPVFPKIKIEMV